MYEAQGKVFLVTGGAAGIGAVLVNVFLEEGAKHIAILDMDVKSGQSMEEQLNKQFGINKVKYYKCDVTTNDLDSAYDQVLKEHAYIDVVINCAGIMNDSPNSYLNEISVNVSALIKSSFKAYDLMRKDHGGSGGTVINISSIVGLYQTAMLPVYAATKSAVLQFSNCLGMEPHYSRSGVRVLTICFGCTDTSLFSAAKMNAFDDETNRLLSESIIGLPMQKIEEAASGLLEAFKRGASGSTWLITSSRPAEDITNNVKKAYEIMSQGVFN